MISMPVELYTDGSCLRNPGAGGFGFLIRYYDEIDYQSMPEEKIIEGNLGFRLTTNNRMEIMATLYGIKKVIELTNSKVLDGIKQLNIFSDSEYLCNAINQRWINRWQENNWMTSGFRGNQPSPVKNKDLWEQIIIMQQELQNMDIIMTITHVKGHADNEYNNKADKLATQASGNGQNHIIDEYYEKTTTVINRR